MTLTNTTPKQSIILLLLFSGCIDKEVEDSCLEFVTYVCSCHPKNPKYDCTELKNIYQNANTEKQEDCALQLDDLIYEDTKRNLSCSFGQPSQNERSNPNKPKWRKAERRERRTRKIMEMNMNYDE